MNPPFRKIIRLSLTAWLGLAAYSALAGTQTTQPVDVQTYAGLTITGEVTRVYSIEFVAKVEQTNDPTAWRALEFLQLPASRYLWTDRSAFDAGRRAPSRRFYRVVAMDPPENMVFIPPGTFRMGSPEDEMGSFLEKPQTEVIISRGFWMGQYEVTQGEYESVMGTNPSWCNGNRTFYDVNGGITNVNFGSNSWRPVERVTWLEAREYCSRLTKIQLSQRRIPSGAAYRLPTDAEWEYACRALTSTRYSYGDDVSRLADFAWYRENSELGTHSVGSKQPNPWGLYDMHGNVWEWCQDFQWPLPGGVLLDPVGDKIPSPTLLNDPNARIFRGGSSETSAAFCRSAARWGGISDFPMPYNGFRMVLSPTPLR